MYHFGERSRNNLEECHPSLQLIAITAIQYIDFAIIEGARGEEEQNKLFHAGKSELEYPNSKHNIPADKEYSMAFDAVPCPIDWGNIEKFYHFGGIMVAVAAMLHEQGKIPYKLRWGGNWSGKNIFSDQTFHDLPHFELIDSEPPW